MPGADFNFYSNQERKEYAKSNYMPYLQANDIE
jgi:hypothetical protein